MAKQMVLKHAEFDLMRYDGANPLDFASAFTEWAEAYAEGTLYISHSDDGIDMLVAYRREETDAEEKVRLAQAANYVASRRKLYEELKKEFETPDLNKFL